MSSMVGRGNVDFTDENVSGLRVQYTSFEKKIDEESTSIQGHSPQAQKNLTSRFKNNTIIPDSFSVNPPIRPSDVMTYDHIVDPDNIVCFYGRDNFLSNYFTAPLDIKGCVYPTVEHYYEACKLFSFGGPQWSAQLKIIRDPGAVKSTVKRLMTGVDKWRVESWKRTEGFAVMESALYQKFSQHADLAEKLLETGDALLVHSNPYDTLWAAGLNAEKVKQWATNAKGTVLKIPRDIKSETANSFPLIGEGQNSLGYFLMSTRYFLSNKKEVIFNESRIVEEDEEEIDEASKKNVEDICLQLAKINVQHAFQQQTSSASLEDGV